jgi:hypothetical protein
MRACLIVVFALMSGCSPDAPNDIAVVSEPPAPEQIDVLQPLPEPEQVDVLQPLTGAVPPVQVQAEEECRQILELEIYLQQLKMRYTELHPEVIGTRSAIARARSGLPADGTFCSEQLEQGLRAAEQPPQQ